MKSQNLILIGILIPFLGTTLGSAMVFLMKNIIHDKIQKLLLGFASRSHDCCLYLVTFNSFYRYGRRAKGSGMGTSCSWFFVRNGFFAFVR